MMMELNRWRKGTPEGSLDEHLAFMDIRLNSKLMKKKSMGEVRCRNWSLPTDPLQTREVVLHFTLTLIYYFFGVISEH